MATTTATTLGTSDPVWTYAEHALNLTVSETTLESANDQVIEQAHPVAAGRPYYCAVLAAPKWRELPEYIFSSGDLVVPTAVQQWAAPNPSAYVRTQQLRQVASCLCHHHSSRRLLADSS